MYFETDFVNVQLDGLNPVFPEIDVPGVNAPWINLNGPGGTEIVEHDGETAFHVWCAAETERLEFLFPNMFARVGKTYTVRMRLWQPDWNPPSGWWEIFVAAGDRPSPPESWIAADCSNGLYIRQGNNSGNHPTLWQDENFVFPVARWFDVQFSIFRDPTEGRFRLVWDGVELCNLSGIKTGTTQDNALEMLKIYNPSGAHEWYMSSFSIEEGFDDGVISPPNIGNGSKDHYVSLSGSDDNLGTEDKPWKSIQKAVNTVTEGETVYIREGVYPVAAQDEPIQPKFPGAPEDYITIRNYPGETVVIQGDYAQPSGSYVVWNAIEVMGTSYLRIEGLTMRGFHEAIKFRAPAHHIQVVNNIAEYNLNSGFVSVDRADGHPDQGGDYLLIEGNIVRHNGYRSDGLPVDGQWDGWGSGISLNHQHEGYRFDDAPGFHTIIRGNLIYGNYDPTGGHRFGGKHTDGSGILMDMSGDLPDVLIANNIVFNNGGRGIAVLESRNVWIVNNTCYRNNFDPDLTDFAMKLGEIAVNGAANGGVANIHVLNNIVVARPDRPMCYFDDLAPGELELKNNLWFGGIDGVLPQYGENAVRADPLLVNGANDSFRPQADSPAIGAGADVSALGVTKDYDGTPRPQGTAYDIGAFEHLIEGVGTMGTADQVVAFDLKIAAVEAALLPLQGMSIDFAALAQALADFDTLGVAVEDLRTDYEALKLAVLGPDGVAG